MYDQKDFQANLQQLRRELLALGLLSIPFLAGIIVSFVLRIQWLTVTLSILYGAIAIFLYNLRIAPVTAYRRYLRDISRGLRREAQGTLVRLDSDETFKEGVRFYTLVVNIDPKLDPEGERLFYYDVCKPLPPSRVGDQVHVLSHGNYVLKLRAV